MNQPLPTGKNDTQLIKDVQYNCDISDARDHGIYSMCSLVLKLRNLYKWEHGLQPWDEPESSALLDWIEEREEFWEQLSSHEFRPVRVNGREHAVDDVKAVNEERSEHHLFYGAGHGRSMKSVFFLAEIVKRFSVEGCPVLLLGREHAREMASPFAMVQEGQVVIRTDPLRFFLYDHIQELRSSCRTSLQFFLRTYGLLEDGRLDQRKLAERLDEMVSGELDLFIYHEVGEIRETSLSSSSLQTLVGRFPASVIEFVCRAVKDVLADTHPCGLLAHTVSQRKKSSLALYVSFLDGLRQELFPEMALAWKTFLEDGNWDLVEQARRDCRTRLKDRAKAITEIAEQAEELADASVQKEFNDRILIELGLEIPNL